MYEQIKTSFSDKGLTFCEFPLEMDGVLNDQASYYLKDYATIYQDVGQQGKVIGNALTVSGNSTIAAPLKFQF